MSSFDVRTGADRCPGALQPFAAEDGLIVRARIPGGEVAIATLQALMRLAIERGTPRIQLTTRANLQIRGLPDPLPADVPARIADAGLLPSISHERARNILAAPNNPLMRSRARALDDRLQRRATLAALPGRFLMLLTDSSGLGLSEPFDIAFIDRDGSNGLLVADSAPRSRAASEGAARQSVASGTRIEPSVSGMLARACSVADAHEAMLDLAERFLAERADERVWNIRDLPAPTALLDGFEPLNVPVADPLPPGIAGPDLVAGVPLGLLSPDQLDALAAVTDTVVITPWRSVLVEGGAANADVLQTAGFITTLRSTWARISACPGAPHCSRAQSETLDLARACADQLPIDGPRLHLVGCERGCGRPRGEHTTVVGAHTLIDVRAATDRRP